MRRDSTGRSWWIAVPSAVALVAGAANAWALCSLLTGGSSACWVGTGIVALIGLVGTFVAVFRTRGPHPVVVGRAAVGLFVAGGVLLLDVGVELFSAWLADGFRTSGR